MPTPTHDAGSGNVNASSDPTTALNARRDGAIYGNDSIQGCPRLLDQVRPSFQCESPQNIVEAPRGVTCSAAWTQSHRRDDAATLALTELGHIDWHAIRWP